MFVFGSRTVFHLQMDGGLWPARAGNGVEATRRFFLYYLLCVVLGTGHGLSFHSLFLRERESQLLDVKLLLYHTLLQPKGSALENILPFVRILRMTVII